MINYKENLIYLFDNFKDVMIDVSIFLNLLQPEWHYVIDPITERALLMKGLYAIYVPTQTKIWVSKNVGLNCAKISTGEPHKWSMDISLVNNFNREEIDRMLNLKAFW